MRTEIACCRVSRMIGLIIVTFLIAPFITIAQVNLNPNLSLTFEIKRDDGKNGSAVAYNPKNKLYYAVFAGNEDYPLETFGRNGANRDQIEAGEDWRGLWWNPKEKKLEGNCFEYGGIKIMALQKNGFPLGQTSSVFSGNDHQPGDHYVGTFDPKSNRVLYFFEGRVVSYDRATGQRNSSEINLNLPGGIDNINFYTLIYTGKKGMEYGVLDFSRNKVYLFNQKNGERTANVNLPSDAPTQEYFNFSYANGHIFIFDTEARKWYGYKVF